LGRWDEAGKTGDEVLVKSKKEKEKGVLTGAGVSSRE
jgi:hypothetical protein